VQEGTFREDLYFRVSVVRIHMPALRERTEDIPLLAEYFLKTFAQAHNKRLHGFSLGFLQALAEHHWPGNVRELQNVIERSLVLADDDEHLSVKDLPQELQDFAIPEELAEGSFHESVRAFKRELVRSALRMHSGNKLQAARKLGISRCYLHRLLNQLSIAPAALEEDSEETATQVVPLSRARSRDLSIASRVI
jgi:transcriptional regulator with PAS, ATPase and Fis domain